MRGRAQRLPRKKQSIVSIPALTRFLACLLASLLPSFLPPSLPSFLARQQNLEKNTVGKKKSQKMGCLKPWFSSDHVENNKQVNSASMIMTRRVPPKIGRMYFKYTKLLQHEPSTSTRPFHPTSSHPLLHCPTHSHRSPHLSQRHRHPFRHGTPGLEEGPVKRAPRAPGRELRRDVRLGGGTLRARLRSAPLAWDMGWEVEEVSERSVLFILYLSIVITCPYIIIADTTHAQIWLR